MKKSESITEINKLADEYARTGDFKDCLSIEHRLGYEGHPYAQEALGDSFTREQINEICKLARSPEEVARRIDFGDWLDIAIQLAKSVAQDQFPGVQIFVHEKILIVKGPTRSFKIKRKDWSNDLEVGSSWEERDGRWLSSEPYNQIPNSNLKGITSKRTMELVMEFAERAAKV